MYRKNEDNNFNKVFANRLNYYLWYNGMTQKALADRLGVSTSTVSNWCMGQKAPRVDKIDAMCEIFDCDRADLVEEPKEKHSYYLDKETSEKAKELFENSDMRVLFDAARGSKPEDLQMAADLLRRLKGYAEGNR